MKSSLRLRRPRAIYVLLFACTALSGQPVYAGQAAPADTFKMPEPPKAPWLSLDEAVRKAIAASPQGEANAARVDALSANRAAADTKPAATVGATLENVGIGGRDLNRQIQLTGEYSQRLERGGKRAARSGRDLECARTDHRLDIEDGERRQPAGHTAAAIELDRIANGKPMRSPVDGIGWRWTECDPGDVSRPRNRARA